MRHELEPVGDPKVGQRWRTEDGYLYDIVAIDGRWVYGRHPNSKCGSTQILRDWFYQPGWEKLREAVRT